MGRYENLFAQLNERREGAFVPFVTLGDPGIEQSLHIIDTLIEAGADALELGVPFSDPLADGPTIQNANLRAFAAGITPAQCFEMLALIREKYPSIPIGLLMYANLVFNDGIDEFYARCKKSAWIPCWSRMSRLKSLPPSVRRRYDIISRRFSSARQMRMTIFCARSLLMAVAILTCFPGRALPVRKIVADCHYTIWSGNLKNIMPRLLCRGLVSPRRNK